ncbi:MAG TPA: ATP-binding protein [Myxococcota bacterium]|nr:ATP-binding protein [Myxococcota bacterium]HQK51032.1 ATP-binding protein [Myxococcota bacterium]
MTDQVQSAEFRQQIEETWLSWLQRRNQTGGRLVLLMTLILYPIFGFLDWVTAPGELVQTLWVIRASVVLLAALFYFLLVRKGTARFFNLLTSLLTLVTGFGIIAMVVLLGGYEHPYYAGINLVMIGTGLLFLWPPRVSVLVYGSIVVGYVLGGLAIGPFLPTQTAISNLFFLVSTAILVTVGSFFAYRSQYEQVRTNQILELTKATLQKANEQLIALDRFKTEFFQNITHELKTPLAMILPPLELMRAGEMGRFSDEQIATIQTMSRNAMKLLKLIQDLLDMARLQDAKVRLRIQQVDFGTYVRDLVESIRPLTDRKGIELTFHQDGGATPLFLDPDKMERVLVNLLSNAAKFTPANGHIQVLLEPEPEGVHLVVADDGPGFPPEQSERIFERFYQVEMGGTRKYGGTGIGLALARELVQLHGGRIWAESQPGKGATFHLHLRSGRQHFRPEVLERRQERRDVASGQRAEDLGIVDWTQTLMGDPSFRLLEIAEATERRVVERDQNEEARPFTILVVEDTADVARLVHLTLRQFARILVAEDGAKGLEIARKMRPDLIVTDLMMPGMDGLEFTRRVRADEALKTVPVVMLTARADSDDQIAGMEAGVSVYLTKPFHPRMLLSTVRSLLHVKESEADVVMTGTMDHLTRIAGGLAHEINNPLNYVKTSVALARADFQRVLDILGRAGDRPLSDEDRRVVRAAEDRSRRMFETAEAGVRRIARTVELMRQYSREGYVRRVTTFDPWPAVEDVRAIVVPAMGRPCEVVVDLQGEARIEGVQEEWNQLLTNLLQNAIEATPEQGGRVEVLGRVVGREVHLTVRDNGPGISREIRDRLFVPFFTTKGPGKGMGLGLTIVWRAVQALHGHIDVAGEEGKGAEFRVRIPAV